MQDILLPLSKEQYNGWIRQVAAQHSNSAIIIDISQGDYPISFCNEAFLEMTGYKLEQVVGQSLHFMNGKKTSHDSISKLQQMLSLKKPMQIKLIQYKADGTAFWHELTCHPMSDNNNEVQCLLLYSKDRTAASLSRMISKLELEVYENLDIDNFDHIDSGIFQLITNKIEDHYLLDMYCTIQLMTENDGLELVGHGSLPLRVAHGLIERSAAIYNSCENDELRSFSIQQSNFSCKQYLDEDLKLTFSNCWVKPLISKHGQIKGFMTLYFEEQQTPSTLDHSFFNRIVPLVLLAQKYKEQKEKLKTLAFYDSYTNLPNAHYFRLKMEEWIRSGYEGIVILIQPSEYSKIVDLYGRQKGDDLLKQIVERLQLHRGNQYEFIARFSNSIIIGSVIPHSELSQYPSRMRQLTIIPYYIAEKEMYITLKIGVGYFTKDSTADDSIRQADIALSKARQENGTSIAYFETEIDEKLKLELETLTEITNGLKNGEFTIFLQPKLNIKTGRIDGFEALSRWHSEKLGVVPPSVFIPLAEQSGLIKDIDLEVLRKTLNWLTNRIQKGLKNVPIAINISPIHFFDEKFLENFRAIVNEYDVPLQLLKLELTESIELVDFTRAKEILNELKSIGIDCSIDDFGVGFSSLSYLPKLPFSEIKIDRSFVNAMHDPGMYAVIQTIIQLASNLQMKAVAEGVETLEQYVMLKNMGCHIGQGYFLHKPMPLEVAGALLDSL